MPKDDDLEILKRVTEYIRLNREELIALDARMEARDVARIVPLDNARRHCTAEEVALALRTA